METSLATTLRQFSQGCGLYLIRSRRLTYVQGLQVVMNLIITRPVPVLQSTDLRGLGREIGIEDFRQKLFSTSAFASSVVTSFPALFNRGQYSFFDLPFGLFFVCLVKFSLKSTLAFLASSLHIPTGSIPIFFPRYSSLFPLSVHSCPLVWSVGLDLSMLVSSLPYLVSHRSRVLCSKESVHNDLPALFCSLVPEIVSQGILRTNSLSS